MRKLIFIFLISLVSACDNSASNHDISDLKTFVAETKAQKPVSRIAPLPELTIPEKVLFVSGKNPFDMSRLRN